MFTNESFARFSIDHMPQGDAYRFVLAMVYIPLIFLSAVTRTAPPFIHLDSFFGQKSRPEDYVYIADWLNAHPFNHPVPNPNALSPQLQHFGNAADKIRDSVKNGADFFSEFILEPGQIDDHTREQVRDCDPEIYLFVLVRSVYIYVFGPKYDEPPPSFFKQQTCQSIEMLRQKYANRKDEIDDLDPLMKNLAAFETPHHDSQVRSILLDLKGAAHLEMQNSLFMTHCWQQACNE